MTRANRFVVVLLGVLAGCATLPPQRARESKTSAAAPTPPPVDPAGTLRDALDPLLEGAAEAAAAGDEVEFDACETVILSTMLASATGCSRDEACLVLAAEVFDELDHLHQGMAEAEEQAAQAGESLGEVVPEPGPVSEQEILQARERARSESFDLPVVVNTEVTSIIEYLTGSFRERFITALQRAAPLLPFIRSELRSVGLPQDLAYLPLVESGFNTKARSRARAQGLWQFMKGTARLYGLRCDGLVDERNDPYLATKAAVSHLAELYASFGDWELALAAYNSGAGRVQRALRRKGAGDDFWGARRFLPRETRNYVPAFWAALVVAKNPEAHGLPLVPEVDRCVGRVKVDGGLELSVLADEIHIATTELADLNPALLYGMTPMTGEYLLAVPCGREGEIAQAIASIPPDRRVRQVFHVVRHGDTVGGIARRYRSSVDAILVANRIRDPRRLRIGQTLVIPRYPGAPVRHESSGQKATKPEALQPPPERYVVKRGDTLYDIARRFGTSVAEIRSRNGLDGSVIRPGDVLKLGR